MNILIINCGSSSLKYQLIDIKSNYFLISGVVERIGQTNTQHSFHLRQTNGEIKKSEINKTADTIHDAFDMVKKVFSDANITTAVSAIGHRVVHGGEQFKQPTLIDNNVLTTIRKLSALAPLHNPVNLTGIEVCLKLFPELPQVAVFDTAFHQTMPEHAYRYAVPQHWYKHHQVRRYGFHGTSHAYVTKQAAEYLKIPINKLNAISLHLGNGASVAAIKKGKSIDTSMGMTPLEGLIMGTRCGDLDPAIPFYIADVCDTNYANISHALNNESGLKGLCGENDMREVQRLAKAGDSSAKLALESYCYRIKKYIGAYLAVLGRLDVLIFTAGVGENSEIIRAKICQNLSYFGIALDNNKNCTVSNQVSEIEESSGLCKILVIKTNEEIEIAQQTIACIQNRN